MKSQCSLYNVQFTVYVHMYVFFNFQNFYSINLHQFLDEYPISSVSKIAADIKYEKLLKIVENDKSSVSINESYDCG